MTSKCNDVYCILKRYFCLFSLFTLCSQPAADSLMQDTSQTEPSIKEICHSHEWPRAH